MSNKTIDFQDLKSMDEKQLKILAKEANKCLAEIEEERRILAERKKNYTLVVPEEKYEFYANKFHRLVMDLARTDLDCPLVIKDKIKAIEEECNIVQPNHLEECYPCPHCGEMDLRAGNYGDDYNPKYKIACDSCSFTAPVKSGYTEHDAWESFHQYLIKNGYLDENTKIPYWNE